MQELTAASAALLVKCVNEAEFESMEGGMNEAYVSFTPAERGNLTDLKKKGYVETCEEDGYYWVFFTEKARPLYEALR